MEEEDINTTMAVPSADMLRLVHAHLTECGLHGTARTLRNESGVGASGILGQAGLLKRWSTDGQWGSIMACLDSLDASVFFSSSSSSSTSNQTKEY
eukprot:scaffold140465_cov28-Attheya_sp.AAC.1